jgi:GNAT superfamily N-acetyltransferase
MEQYEFDEHGGHKPYKNPEGSTSIPGLGCSHCQAAFYTNEGLSTHMDDRHSDKPKATATVDGEHRMEHYPYLMPHSPHLYALFDHKTNQGLASMSLDHDGTVNALEVHPDYRRQGLATKLWSMATEHAKTSKAERGWDIPEPKHSTMRTPEGDAWARSTGAAGVPIHGMISSRQMQGIPTWW